jgi:nucleoside triphosphate pyrophosphatase
MGRSRASAIAGGNSGPVRAKGLAALRVTAATPLALGSASPRRRELLAMIGVPLVVHPAAVDERLQVGEEPDAYLERIALAKLDAVRATDLRRDVAAVLVADTIVIAPRGDVLGKPSDVACASGRTIGEEGRAMLEILAGATHEVRTRFVLSLPEPASPIAHAETVATRVTFRAMTTEEVRAYAQAGEGSDKAGGYALQGNAAAFIERIDGSYTSVVGLPLCQVVVALRALRWWH